MEQTKPEAFSSHSLPPPVHMPLPPPPVPERKRSGSTTILSTSLPPASTSRLAPPVPRRESRGMLTVDWSEVDAEIGMEGTDWSATGDSGGNGEGDSDEWEIMEMDDKGQVISKETTKVPRPRRPQPPYLHQNQLLPSHQPLYSSSPMVLSYANAKPLTPSVPNRSSTGGSGAAIGGSSTLRGMLAGSPTWKAALEAKLGAKPVMKAGSGLPVEWLGEERRKDNNNKEHQKEREKEKEKGREKKEKQKEAKEKEKEKKPTVFMIRKKNGKTHASQNSGGNSAVSPGQQKKKGGGSLIISDPGNAKHKVHVDFDYQWTGQDPAGEFRLITKVGQGAFGKVYKAEHKDTGFILAIKCIPMPENISTETMKEVENLKKEIAILKNCRCPSIVSYYGMCFRHSTLWLMMELLELGSVMDVMRETEIHNFSEPDVAFIMKCVVPGLVYLHSANIIHRDIKGANILLTADGKAKLGDFGTSSYLKSSGTQTVAGTPLFMSPEVLNEEGYNFKADIWSLGITMLQIAEGKPPFYELNVGKAMLRIVTGPPPAPREPHKWSKEFIEFASVCLQLSEKMRPDAKDLLKQPFIANVDPRYELTILKKYKAIRAKKSDATKEGVLTAQIEPQWPTGPGQKRVRQVILNGDPRKILISSDEENPNPSYGATPPTPSLNSPTSPPFLRIEEDEHFDTKLSTLDRKELENMVRQLKTQWKKEKEAKKKWKRLVKEGGTSTRQL